MYKNFTASLQICSSKISSTEENIVRFISLLRKSELVFIELTDNGVSGIFLFNWLPVFCSPKSFQRYNKHRTFSVGAPPPKYVMPPKTEYLPIRSQQLCKNMTRESGGANNMHPLSRGGTNGKDPKNVNTVPK